MTPEDIVELAERYITVAECNFPEPGELFALFIRDIPTNKVLKDNEGWRFMSYGLCRHYLLDEQIKPRGKWLHFTYADLSRYPLADQSLQLQPPHVILGKFTTPDRSHEIKMEKCVLQSEGPEVIPGPRNESADSKEKTQKGKILQFPKPTQS